MASQRVQPIPMQSSESETQKKQPPTKSVHNNQKMLIRKGSSTFNDTDSVLLASQNLGALVNCNNHDVIDGCVDGVEGFVGCVEGVDRQHRFEESLSRQAKASKKIAAEHGLSEAEATVIRLQMMADSASDPISKAVESTLPELDVINNICGNEDGTLVDEQTCGGVVSPRDTTLPTSQPVNAGGKSARSLVDVEDDGYNECVATNSIEEDDNSSEEYCAICSDKKPSNSTDGSGGHKSPTTTTTSLCRLPCCDSSKDGTNVCNACMLVLTVATSDGSSRIGRCLRCRSWLSIKTLHSPTKVGSATIRKIDTSGTCQSCETSVNTLVEENPKPICDSCFLARFPLNYECQDCHQYQSIGQPIYRSQQTANSYGTEMWVCTNCEKSSYWRIGQDQLPKIAANDVPLVWGDCNLNLAKERVQTARKGIAKLDLRGRDASGQMREECCIL